MNVEMRKLAAGCEPGSLGTIAACKRALKAVGLRQSRAPELLAEAAILTRLRAEAEHMRALRRVGRPPAVDENGLFARDRHDRYLAELTATIKRAPNNIGTARTMRPVLLPTGTPAERHRTNLRHVMWHAIRATHTIGRNDVLHVYVAGRGAAAALSQTKEVDRNLYRGRFKGWECKYRGTTITVPSDWRVRVRGAGIETVEYASGRRGLVLDACPVECQGETVHRVTYIVQGRGTALRLAEGYLARNENTEALADTPEAAVARLARKRTARRLSNREKFARIVARYPDLVITLDDMLGLACEAGVMNWLLDVGWSGRTCATLAEIDKAIAKAKYGYEHVAAAVRSKVRKAKKAA